MKKILLISDTHGYIDDKILSYCKSVDEVWHAGDIGNIEVIDKIKQIKPLKGVYGNIDNHLIRKEFPLDNKFNCENIKVWITHIGGYPGRYSRRVSDYLKSEKVDLFVSISQSANQPDIEQSVVTTNEGQFDIGGLSIGDTVGYADIFLSNLSTTATLKAGVVFGQNYAFINAVESLGDLIGFFSIEN
mgnify:CR=1 FL=1